MEKVTIIDDVVRVHITSAQDVDTMESNINKFCMDNKIPLLIFGLDDPSNIEKAVMGENIGTIVKEG